MAPSGTANLFHPKKKAPQPPNAKKGSQATNGDLSSTKKRLVPRPPRPKTEPTEDAKLPVPEGTYSDFRLMSSALNGWKYDVMKFDSRKPVDITTWTAPVKLNRKDPRREVDNSVTQAPPQAVGPMLGPDGKPVIGADGRVVMVDVDGKPIRPGETNGASASSSQGSTDKGKDKDKAAAARKRFQKKTKQVFLVPDAVRQLRREERYPWVLEDASKSEVWVGKMEEVVKSETQAMFMPTSNDCFKFVPAHRWYKFQKKPSYYIPNLEEAETLMSQIQKNKDPERWLLRHRNGQGPSESTVAMFKSERSGSTIPNGSSLVQSASQSVGPGGRKLKTVDSGMDGLFGDDDDDEDSGARKRKLKRELGAEGDYDEFEFEEEFADDEEKVEADGEDEEMKELEERLKREYKSANKTREGYIDESEDEDEDGVKLSGAGQDMRKLMKKLEKGSYDESDDEKNPYASSEEESEEEEPPQVPTGPAIQPPPERPSRSQTPATKTSSQSAPKAEGGSRATSPIPAGGHGGHSIVAKRATSPKAPKLKTNSPSRAGSPLAPGGPTSPTGGIAGGQGSRASSPSAQATQQVSGVPNKPSNKRKATDDPTSPTNGTGLKPKKRKAQAPAGELEEHMVIDWLKNTPNATTRDCIHHFTPYLTTEEKKQSFTKLVKEVATLKGGVLVLRNAYRAGSKGASTPPVGSPKA
ncbi:hypothetical protein C8Q75DRAFT_729532 [Abortiporus biennis]|nr:hypothetical protein C8Q75DRAFT_729532 [Abortiporus biennis]